MKMFVLFFAFCLYLPTLATEEAPAESTTVEAWLSESSFNGKTFDYAYTVFDEGVESKENIEVLCEFSEFQRQTILSAIKIKIWITARFANPGQELRKSGSVDIRSAVNSCRQKLPPEMMQKRMPVQVKLPSLSTPSL